MFGISRENKAFRFIILFLGMFLGWMMLYHWLINPWGQLDKLVINDASLWSLWILEKMGYPVFLGHNPIIRTIGIDGTHGLWIGDPCNGITIFAFFSFFILAYPGNWIRKLWFIPLGITLIHTLNIVRIVLLCVVVKHHPDWLEFNHTYLFQIIMYLFVFTLWYIWITRLSRQKTAE